ncbi:transporter [Ganoderma sinense ZZ0214-1]|uniref:laccase n=1 Tax=Ganoderma sinense ZZ0214-1 TaxID=1077348 RepID=A0A2G8S9J8_9APHY|nr:transporter [Ganoderma sinense ZZ0214-1]
MAKGSSFIRVAIVFLATVAQRSLAATVVQRSPEAIGPVGGIKIVNKVIAPDGFHRDAVLADAKFPGPMISGYTGDHFKITVEDELHNSTMLTPTSIHWHGILQHTTNWADGPAFVTQCPITTGNSFTYKFNTDGITGTYWYHSHFETQYCDGLRGPLVIYDKDDPHKHLYDVDDESTIITLADWYHVAAQFVVPRSAPGPPGADSTLINGKGRYFADPSAELAVIKVTEGKRYRFRLISVSCDPNYSFTIAHHSMTIIEADGQNTEPLTVDQIQIYAAQRYSFVLEANQAVDNYWIRALPSAMFDPHAMGTANGINSAILRYEGAPEEEPTHDEFHSTNPLYEWNLHPLTDPKAPGEHHPGGVDFAMNINVNSTGVGRSFRFTINDVSFHPPPMPVLLQILSGAKSAHSLLPKGSVFGLTKGATVELTIPGGSRGAPHPFHLHGHAFSVVRSAGQTVPNYKNPVRRDVVNTGSNSSDHVTIRFKADNPGPWFFHCHIDFHLNLGLAIVFAEDVPEVPFVDAAPKEWYDLCPEYYASLGKEWDHGSD